MTLATERKRVGRKPLTIVEADLDLCQLSIGQAPCTAVPHGNSILYAEQLDMWSQFGSPTVTPNTDNYNGELIADTVEDAQVALSSQINNDAASFDVTKFYTAGLRVKIDAIGRVARFPSIRLRFRGSTTEDNELKFDTETGEYSLLDGSGNAKALTMIDPLDPNYRIVAVSAKSNDPLNTVSTLAIFPARGDSASWVNSVTTTGSIIATRAQLVEGHEADTLPIYAKTTTAAVAANTNGVICYNTRKTCQDPANYDKGTKSYRFCENIAGLPIGLGAIPCVKSVSSAPTRITPNKGLGYRASITVEMTDLVLHDRGVDPYFLSRTDAQGTYFGRLLARNPYYKGRTIRVLSGYLEEDGTYDAANFETRSYIIDSFEIGSNSKVTIKAKDVLTKLDFDKAQAPIASTGTLSALLTIGATSLVLQTGEGADYNDPTVTLINEYIRIGDEIIQYTGISTDTLTGLVRSSWSSVADEHKADASVQQCLPFENINCTDVTSALLTDYANIDPSLIPTVKWDIEKDTYLAPFDVNAIITAPISVSQLVSELSEQSLFNIWWDEREQEITLRSISPYLTDTPLDDGSNFMDMQVKDIPKDRISQLWVYYDLNDRVNPGKEESYESLHIQIDLESEGTDKYDEKKIKKIKSRWYQAAGPVIAYASRTLKWMADTPKNATFKLDAKDGLLWTGDPIDVLTDSIQNFDGSDLSTEMFVLEASEDKDGNFKYMAMNSPFIGRYGVIMVNGSADYAGENIGGYIAPDAAGFSDGGEAFKII